MEVPTRSGLEEYAESLDLTLEGILELLEAALSPETGLQPES